MSTSSLASSASLLYSPFLIFMLDNTWLASIEKALVKKNIHTGTCYTRLPLDFAWSFYTFIGEQTWLIRQRCSPKQPTHSPPTPKRLFSNFCEVVNQGLYPWCWWVEGPLRQAKNNTWMIPSRGVLWVPPVFCASAKSKSKNNTYEDGLTDVLTL